MADIVALKNKYFAQSSDANPPSEPLPATFDGCLVRPLIDGRQYFDELVKVLSTVGTGATPADNAEHFIYIAGWWLHLMGGKVDPAPGSAGSGGPILESTDPFALDGPGGSNRFIELLKSKSKSGVDVRVLGWISWSVMASTIAQSGAASIRDVNVGTLSTIRELRQEPTLAKKACLNIISHSAGAAHTKLLVVGNGTTAVGFTGGIDFVSSRHSDELHTNGSWHDVQVRVEGRAVQMMYDFFKDLWNENIARPVKAFRLRSENVPSSVPQTPSVPSKALPMPSVGKHHVQSLRTVPQFNYAQFNGLPENPPISFAPSGLFEVRIAWRKAILAAEKYLYMEDQSFWSVEVMSWINQAVKSQVNLKIILVTGVADPGDPNLPPFIAAALFNGLLPGLTSAQKDQIQVFGRSDVTVHSKTTLIDDHWALIGSANCMRRSLYSDIEHSVAVLDEDDALVPQYRIDLWGSHFKLATAAERLKISNLDQALNVWNLAWGTGGSGVVRPPNFILFPLPTAPPSISSAEQEKYDRYYDLDSRQDWGGCLP